MIRKIMIVSFVVLGTLSILFQGFQAWKFINAGPRFTAMDGAELCERVAALELRATGTRMPCVYPSGK